jgi:hypothetical protein
MSLSYPWISTEQLETQLGAALDPDIADRLVMAATQAVAGQVSLVDSEGEPLTDVPEAVVTAVLFIASEIYKASVGIDGSLQVSYIETLPATLNTVLVRRYGVLLAPWLNSGAVVG